MKRWGYGGRILDFNPRRPHGGMSPGKHSYVWLPDRRTHVQTDGQTPDKVIPMWCHASQATQKGQKRQAIQVFLKHLPMYISNFVSPGSRMVTFGSARSWGLSEPEASGVQPAQRCPGKRRPVQVVAAAPRRSRSRPVGYRPCWNYTVSCHYQWAIDHVEIIQ